MPGTKENTPEAPPHERRGAFRLLFFALLAIGAGNTMLISAVLPPLTRSLEMPDWMAGAVFSFSALCWSIGSPFWGKKSNTWGRRRVAALGLAGYSLSMALFALSASLAMAGTIQGALVIFLFLAGSRAVFGLVGSASTPAAQAYVADRTSREERTEEIASVTSGFSVGTVVGPAFAAALVSAFTFLSPTYGLISPVVVTMLLAGSMSILLLTRLPEQRQPRADANRVTEIPGAAGLWRQGRVAPFLVYAVALSVVTGVLTQTFLFAVMDKMEVSGALAVQYTGPAFTLGAVGVLLSQLVLIPRLKYSSRTLMIVGAIPMVVGALMIIPAGKNAYSVLIMAQFLIGLGQGLVRPGFSSGASLAVTPELQGNVAGLVISANGLGYVVTPFFGLYVYEYVAPWVPFAFSAVVLTLMSVFAAAALKTDAERVADANDGSTGPDG